MTAERPLVGLVLVAHSSRLAEGVAELAGQMAPDVGLHAAGGLPDGSLGTDYDTVVAALDAADRGAGVVVLYDLGSGRLTAELAIETMADPETVRLVDAPLVEGAVAAAVAAQGGANRDTVAAAAASAVDDLRPAPATVAAPVATPGATASSAPLPGATGTSVAGPSAAGERAPDAATPAAAGETVRRDLVLHNEIGLHARPAALLIRVIAELDARVEVRFGESTVDGRSVLGLMGLNARQGDTLTVTAVGPQAAEAVAAIADLIARDFDE